MILLLGSTGYVGKEFERILFKRNVKFTTISRTQIDYTSRIKLVEFLRLVRPIFIINAAGFTGKPNVDACELQKDETTQGNVYFPKMLAEVCAELGIPWGHVSSGCIFSGCLVEQNGKWTAEKNMNQDYIRKIALTEPSRLKGFDESFPPNFCFNDGPCSYYSGTKALGEEAIKEIGSHYVWRLRIPFNEINNPRNYLTKIQTYAKVYDNLNSLSQLEDFVNACIDCWVKHVPYGVYNVTNPGFVSTRQVVELIKTVLSPKRDFTFWENDEEFYRLGAKALRSNCILDSSKLRDVGISVRNVDEAIKDSLIKWKS
jgi:nucleoside-diphosphate-sugar epimerase